MSATALHPFGSPFGSSTKGIGMDELNRGRSERQFYLDKEPDSYWINVYALRRNGALDTSSVFEAEADAAADAKRPSPEYQYLYTLWISKTGNPQVRDVLGVTLIEGEGLDK